jgi:hypothetical protein
LDFVMSKHVLVVSRSSVGCGEKQPPTETLIIALASADWQVDENLLRGLYFRFVAFNGIHRSAADHHQGGTDKLPQLISDEAAQSNTTDKLWLVSATPNPSYLR